MNGPSIVRLVRTTLQGWQRYKHHADPRIRKRFAWDARDLPYSCAGSLWAARSWFRSQPGMREKISQVLEDVYKEFGIKARLAAPLIGRYLRCTIGREERRLRRGWTYEPPTFYETNQEVLAAEEGPWKQWWRQDAQKADPSASLGMTKRAAGRPASMQSVAQTFLSAVFPAENSMADKNVCPTK